MMLNKKLFFSPLILIFCLTTSSTSLSEESCPKISIPNDRSIELSIKRSSTDLKSDWTIQGTLVVDRELEKVFEAAKKVERLENVIPLINIFNLSKDRKKLQCGIQILPGVRFQQTFQIEILDEIKKFNLKFVEGSFTGLTGEVCFSSYQKNQTAVTINAFGHLDKDPIPFFITNSILEHLSKSVLRRWRNDIEN